MDKIVLASRSPRRKLLLEWAEISFEVVCRDTDESYPPELPVEEIPVYIARNKALAVKQEIGRETVIIAADTIVVLNDQIIGKPANSDDAIRILTSLSGQKHRVITGVVIAKEDKELAFADITEVTFHHLTYEQIAYYVHKYQPFDKAGAYAIQEWIGVIGLHAICGDFYNVMGLPVSRVVKALHILNNG